MDSLRRVLDYPLSTALFDSLDVTALRRVNADAVAFVDEGRDGDRDAVFERCGFVDIGDGRAFQCRFGARHGQLK